MVTEVTEEEINSLTQSILLRYGIDFTCYEPKSLRRRIIRVVNLFGLTSIHELWVRFLRDAKFIHEFMNEVSVGMTSMFRDPVLWKNMKRRMVPEFALKSSFSIWHAGCSTGEEVYTMGIILQEAGLQEKATALATDISVQAIEEAKNGVYHKIKMIENETNYRAFNPYKDFSKYYIPDEKHVAMRPDLISHTSFSYHNLITDSFAKGFDLILCRNVMIYFDSIAKARLLNQFYDALNPGGYFVIGFFDTMNYLIDNRKFELVDEEAKIFRKIN